MSNLNPDIRTVSIGVRELREVTIYPLSISDQLKMTDIITKVAQTFSQDSIQEMNDMETIVFAVEAIEKNAATMLKLVMDPKEKASFGDITNNQLSEIAHILYEVNYETVIKNSKDLFKRIKSESALSRSLPESSKTPVTD